MILFKKINDLRKWLDVQRQNENSVGFVPTMGALHGGHISLIGTSGKENKVTVCSIFVNPAQFNDPKDFAKYPVTIEKDIDLLEGAGCDLLFLPSVNEIYPAGINSTKEYDLGYLETVLEGQYRPGHFQGVCRVMDRLLGIVEPGHLYLGQKDYQQCGVIKRLVSQVFPGNKIKISICPTIRETDGLAMSSRNMRLGEAERKKATAIYQSLLQLKKDIRPGSLSAIKQKARQFLEKAGFKVDYVEIANAETLAIVNDWNGREKLVALAAAYLNEVRLIDNVIL